MFNRIRELRNELNLSQTNFGKSIGRSLIAIQQYESGKRKLDDSILLLIERTYNVNPLWLRNGVGEMFNVPVDKPNESARTSKSSHDAMIINALPNMTDEEKEFVLKYIKDRLEVSELRKQTAELKKENAG